MAATGAQTGGRDGFWRGSQTFRQTSLVVDPPDGRMPPITPEALKRAAPRDRGSFGNGPFDGPEDFTLYDRCITRGIVGGVLPVPYGNGNRILQTPDAFIISYEMIHDTRVVPLDGRPHLGQNIRQYLGDSRGHWEGNTLVVETTNFTDQTSVGGGNGNGLRHSAAMKHDRTIHAHGRRRAGSTGSRSTIRRPTRGRGRSSCRWSRRQDSRRCPTSATRETARSNTSWPPSAPRTRRSPRI